MMGSRRFEITIVSAANLPDARLLGRMKVYAEVSLNGSTAATLPDMEGESSPRWDSTFSYNINESDLRRPGLDAVVSLYCKRTLGDKLIGCVFIPVKTLFERGITSQKSLGYPIAGTANGRLYIRYWFREKSLLATAAAARGGGADGLDFKLKRLSFSLTADFDKS